MFTKSQLVISYVFSRLRKSEPDVARVRRGMLGDGSEGTRMSGNATPCGETRAPPLGGSDGVADMVNGGTKSRRFVEAFTDYWLDLRKIDDTAPSTTLYNDYEMDDALKLAALEETRLFVAELLRADLPARNIVDSDCTFLNERLATVA